MLAAGPTYYIDVKKFDTAEEILAGNSHLREVRYAGITADELERYPALKNAINGYDLNKNEYGSAWSKVDNNEWNEQEILLNKNGVNPGIFSVLKIKT